MTQVDRMFFDQEDDLRRRYSVDPFSKHNSQLRAYSVKYNIWTERLVSPPCDLLGYESCPGLGQGQEQLTWKSGLSPARVGLISL